MQEQDSIKLMATKLARVGGMAACGQHRGVFVGTDIAACPNGWIFMMLGDATTEQVQDAIKQAKHLGKEDKRVIS